MKYPDDHERHDHCGCCGRCFAWLRSAFCVDCTSRVDHLGGTHLHVWDRTYEAVHGQPCPFRDDT